jgi:DNA-binding response OmpR family regulator
MAKTVLVIDSHVAVRKMLNFALEVQGCRTVGVDGGGAADTLEALGRGGIDLLVLGINGPDDENSTLVGQVRLQPDLEGLPILLVGEPRLKLHYDLRAIGSCAWLNKPFRMHEIQGLVENLFGNAPLRPLPGDRK